MYSYKLNFKLPFWTPTESLSSAKEAASALRSHRDASDVKRAGAVVTFKSKVHLPGVRPSSLYDAFGPMGGELSITEQPKPPPRDIEFGGTPPGNERHFQFFRALKSVAQARKAIAVLRAHPELVFDWRRDGEIVAANARIPVKTIPGFPEA